MPFDDFGEKGKHFLGNLRGNFIFKNHCKKNFPSFSFRNVEYFPSDYLEMKVWRNSMIRTKLSPKKHYEVQFSMTTINIINLLRNTSLPNIINRLPKVKAFPTKQKSRNFIIMKFVSRVHQLLEQQSRKTNLFPKEENNFWCNEKFNFPLGG